MTKETVANSEMSGSNVVGFINSRKHGTENSSLAPANMKSITETSLNSDELALYYKYGTDQISDRIDKLQAKNDEIMATVDTLSNSVSQINETIGLLNKSLLTLHTDILDSDAKSLKLYGDYMRSFMLSFGDLTTLSKTLGREIISVRENATSSSDETNRLLQKLIDVNNSQLATVRNVQVAPTVQAEDTVTVKRTDDVFEMSTDEWLKKAWRSAEVLSAVSNRTKKGILGDIYNIFRRDGIDFDKRMEEYRRTNPSNAKYLDMIAATPSFRYEFMEYTKKLFVVYRPDKANTFKDNSNAKLKYSQTPEPIAKAIEEYRKRHSFKSYSGTIKSLSTVMNNLGGINMRAIREAKAAEVNYKNISFGYVVNDNPKLRVLFNDVVYGC